MAALLLLPAREAAAHGGQFVPPAPATPGGAAPPGTPRGNTPTAVTPGVGGPIVTPGDGALRVGPVGRRHRQDFTPTFDLTWDLWWRLEQEAFLPERPVVLRPRAITPAAPESEAPARRWEDERRRLVREVARPLLLGLLDPAKKVDADVRASAAIALGKVTEHAETTDILLSWLEKEDAPALVREGAALGLGLLRRTRPELELPAARLDPLRARLLQVFDQTVDGRRIDVPEKTRQMAMFAIGLLGDQPWSPDERSRDGRLLTSLLWQRLKADPYRHAELRIAVLTALRLQPGEGFSDEVRSGMEQAARGEGDVGKRWGPAERAHALAAIAGHGGSRGLANLLRFLDARSASAEPVETRLAASLALLARIPELNEGDRFLAERILEASLGQEQEMLQMGLLDLALGRIVGRDVADGSDRLLTSTHARDLLLARAQHGPWYVRGYGVLALALAARSRRGGSDAARAFHARAERDLEQILRDASLDPDLRGAAAVGLGLLGSEAAVSDLVPLVRNPALDAGLRGHAALSLGEIGVLTPDVEHVLRDAVLEEGPESLRASASLGLAMLGGSDTAKQLVEALSIGRRTSYLAGVTMALSRLGDLGAVGPLAALAAREDRSQLVRAMAVVALGRLLDPERTPSLFRLVSGSPYPARTPALEDAFTIL